MDFSMTPRDKLTKSVTKLLTLHPFFGWLVQYLDFIEMEKIPTMGVDGSKKCYYNSKFVAKLTDSEVVGVLCHEVLHLSMEHPMRTGNRNIVLTDGKGNSVTLWNIATDIVINNIIAMNSQNTPVPMSLPSGAYIPENDSITIFGKVLSNISEKSSEEIYEELKTEVQQKLKQSKDDGKEGMYVSGEDLKTSDDHSMWGKDADEGGESKDAEGTDKSEKIGKSNVNWSKIAAEAYNLARMRGTEPAGLGREYDTARKPKVPWKTILRKEVAKVIPYDLTWSRPNKKYIHSGIYLPSTTGEEIKILISIDTSGSMSKEDLSQCLSEITSLSRAYSGIEFRLITHDVTVHDDYRLFNGNMNKLRDIKIHGGGGTSHQYLYEYIKEKRYKEKLLISFTDGYSDIQSVKRTKNTVFVLVGRHIPPQELSGYGRVVTISD